jgi:hypothetical protein
MKWLVDTNVLSEVTKPFPSPKVEGWLRLEARNAAIDPIILGELRYGILVLPRGARRNRLEAWFNGGARTMHCLPWDGETGLQWASLLARLRSKGLVMPLRDSMIVATALAHKLTLATRNVRDFEAAGVPLFNPFA